VERLCAGGFNEKSVSGASRLFAGPILKGSKASIAVDRERLKWAQPV
jgi:hypothetical protein